MLNQLTIMGRLVRDPELRRTSSGIAVASFTVAVDRDYTGQNNEKATDFIDCVAWRQTGEFVSKYFTKGRMIVVTGRIETRNWTDKDGNKRKSTEVNAESCYFADSKRQDEQNAGNYSRNQGGSAGNANAGGFSAPGNGGNAYGGNAYGANAYGNAPSSSSPVVADQSQPYQDYGGFGGFANAELFDT